MIAELETLLALAADAGEQIDNERPTTTRRSIRMTITDRTGLDAPPSTPGRKPSRVARTIVRDESAWHKSACILCECNCGVEIRLGPDGHTFDRIRGDKDHPASKGYTCEKALRLDHYQNGRGERVLQPATSPRRRHLRRGRLGHRGEGGGRASRRVRDEFGGDKILYYGGGGQGNHLGGAYGAALHKGFGGRYRSSAIAQEKSGEIWVNGVMFGNAVRGEFDECEVAFFIGKNPWMSHGIPHARTTLKAIANDEDRSMVVIDPRVTETAELADFHLQVAPGRDAWLLAAMVAIIVQERLAADAWLGEHADGLDAVNDRFATHRRRRVLRDLRRRRGPRPSSDAAARRGVERRGVRGPRHPDEPSLDARQLPREARVDADRQLRQPRRTADPLDDGAAREGLLRRARCRAGAA